MREPRLMSNLVTNRSIFQLADIQIATYEGVLKFMFFFVTSRKLWDFGILYYPEGLNFVTNM